MSAEQALRRVVLFGAGRMGAAMLAGWMRNPSAAGIGHLDVVEPVISEPVAAASASGHFHLNHAARPVDVVILSVKPQAYASVEDAVKAWTKPDTVIVSIMAGVTIARLQSGLGVGRVIRAMPNTPGAIGQGVTGYAMSSACGDAEKQLVDRLLASLGAVAGPLPEDQMDAVTAVSGSGPAYVYLLAECLAEAGRASGLDEATAKLLAHRTVVGAGALLAQGSDPAVLREGVTSPGGTTAAALGVFMKDDRLKALVREAVAAAEARSKELSRS
jgi:pyrroline-5-carboxylate reductase